MKKNETKSSQLKNWAFKHQQHNKHPEMSELEYE